ncbi:hypothetical protein [Thalassomonas actiniarum]|uniref:Uncharacterized protein n=1 Tax=Thalassomonas actiniarum TaxID=485447 RepID=A0AAF0C2C1_9GAMM|nr:hypothetical protein [Thalassomonas actiniarum]WDD97645.1 hypothetical protein SG35_020365 [Thalassomonas actiniarum]
MSESNLPLTEDAIKREQLSSDFANLSEDFDKFSEEWPSCSMHLQRLPASPNVSRSTPVKVSGTCAIGSNIRLLATGRK